MATDRGAVLTIRAAARGVIDFTKADILDVNWWRRVNAVINAMTDEDNLTLLQTAHAKQLALVGNGSLQPDDFKNAQLRSHDIYNGIVNALQPWNAKTPAQAVSNEMEQMIDTYKRLIGDPNDPAFRKKMQESVAAFNASQTAIPVESDDDRVSRLIRERHMPTQRRKPVKR